MKQLFLISTFILLFFKSNAQSPFLIPPYVQLGTSYTGESLELIWHTKDSISHIKLEITALKWQSINSISKKKIQIQNTSSFYTYTARLQNLIPGVVYNYKIKSNKNVIFEASFKAPKKDTQSYSFIAIGDIGAETAPQKKIAQLAYQLNPDFVAIPGDIVYDNGLLSEYATKFWPIYNAAKVDSNGAPLMRSIPFIAAVGNHDVDNVDLIKNPDALAYYYYFSNPLNGPLATSANKLAPPIKGDTTLVNQFKNNVGSKYPTMNTYSFNYANAHWLVLDADNFVDWTNKELLQWVAQDLKGASASTWRFVLFHHPGFSSSADHYEQQQMRALSPIFENEKVDIVFNGHVHNYQRSFPLFFKPDNKGYQLIGGKEGTTLRGRVINGIWKLDKHFDGISQLQPNGVIYIVTGAGGNDLYNPEQSNDEDTWQKFTNKFNALEHSLSFVSISGNKLTFQQIGEQGTIIDSFKIEKK